MSGFGGARTPGGDGAARGRGPVAFTTVECRWFFDGRVPEPVVTWFRDVRPWPREAEPVLAWPRRWRTDRYLVLGDREEMGVKERNDPEAGGAPIEFKGRCWGPRREGLGMQAVARVEGWAKWSVPRDQVPLPLRRLFLDEAHAVAVRKLRLLRRARLPANPDSMPVEVSPAGEPPRRMIELELSRIEADGHEAWTLAFEASPDDHGLRGRFPELVATVLRESPVAGRLTEGASVGYAGWLAGSRAP